MAFNPLLFAAGTGAAVASSLIPNAGSLGRLFSTRSQQNFKSAEWLAERQDRTQKQVTERQQAAEDFRADKEISLVFPTDLGKYFMSFQFVRYKRDNPSKNAKRNPTDSFYLPIPDNLKENTNLQYNHNPLGTIAGGVEQGLRQGSEVIPSPAEAAFGTSQYGGNLLGAAASLITRGRIQAITGAAAIAAANEGVRRSIQLTAGMVLNPFSAVTFDNVNFRTHSFQWKLAPTSQSESDILYDIKRLVNKRILPFRNTITFDYPDLVMVKIHPSDVYLYSFKPCFITNFSVDFAPSQVPAFYRGTGAPVEVVMSMNLIETEIWTSQDFEGTKENSNPIVRLENNELGRITVNPDGTTTTTLR
jgi:hypothetical protein